MKVYQEIAYRSYIIELLKNHIKKEQMSVDKVERISDEINKLMKERALLESTKEADFNYSMETKPYFILSFSGEIKGVEWTVEDVCKRIGCEAQDVFHSWKSGNVINKQYLVRRNLST